MGKVRDRIEGPVRQAQEAARARGVDDRDPEMLEVTQATIEPLFIEALENEEFIDDVIVEMMRSAGIDPEADE